jgi:hypothetical protein
MADFEEEPITEEILQVDEPTESKEVKLFGRWTFSDVEVRDISLAVRFNRD